MAKGLTASRYEHSGCADDDLLEPAIEKLESVINSKQELITAKIEAKQYEYELCRKANQDIEMRLKEKEAELFEMKKGSRQEMQEMCAHDCDYHLRRHCKRCGAVM